VPRGEPCSTRRKRVQNRPWVRPRIPLTCARADSIPLYRVRWALRIFPHVSCRRDVSGNSLGGPGLHASASAAAPQPPPPTSASAHQSNPTTLDPTRYAAQIYEKAASEIPDLEAKIAAGEFKPLRVRPEDRRAGVAGAPGVGPRLGAARNGLAPGRPPRTPRGEPRAARRRPPPAKRRSQHSPALGPKAHVE
jgi:hypothetical protein